MYLFDLASRHMSWLADRQSVTAANIANADTPGYRVMDAGKFDLALDQTNLEMMKTNPSHLSMPGHTLSSSSPGRGASWDEANSGNNVSIENELIQAGHTSRMMGMDTVVTRTFHRMLLTSLKV